MTYSTQLFSEDSLRGLSDAISTYLAANPTYVPIAIYGPTSGKIFQSILIYSAP